MQRGFGTVIVAAVFLAAIPGCSKKAEEKPGAPAEDQNLGDQVGNTLWDERVVAEATGPSNAVIRAMGDCDAVKAALPAAETALTDALAKIRTVPGRASLESMRAQVKRIADACL